MKMWILLHFQFVFFLFLEEINEEILFSLLSFPSSSFLVFGAIFIFLIFFKKFRFDFSSKLFLISLPVFLTMTFPFFSFLEEIERKKFPPPFSFSLSCGVVVFFFSNPFFYNFVFYPSESLNLAFLFVFDVQLAEREENKRGG